MRTSIAFAGAIALACLAAGPALAGDVSFVSVTGDDARNCAAPTTACRTFQRAHDATSPHGEIFALTPGDYRPVTITKSISVTGVEGAGIFGGQSDINQIAVAAGASGVVYLTGLTLDGFSTAARSVDAADGSRVLMRNCTIRNHNAGAIKMANGKALIEATSVANNLFGLFGTGAAPMLVHRVVARGSRENAIDSDAIATISETSVANGNGGIAPFGAAPFFVSRSVVTGNSGAGVSGAITSAGDNLIRGNKTNVSGTITNIGRQ